MPPKPKYLFVIQASDVPVAVFRDEAAAREFMGGLGEASPDTVHGLFTVRLYEYSVGTKGAGLIDHE
jgi:hypothetical protein